MKAMEVSDVTSKRALPRTALWRLAGQVLAGRVLLSMAPALHDGPSAIHAALRLVGRGRAAFGGSGSNTSAGMPKRARRRCIIVTLNSFFPRRISLTRL